MSSDSSQPQKKKSKLPLILGILAVCAVSVEACCGGVAWFGYGVATAPRDAAISAMENNAEIAEKLGKPLEAGSRFNLTNFENNNGNGKASIGFDVKGPNGSANVDADMNLTGGTWSVVDLTATCSDGTELSIPAGVPVEVETAQ